MALVAVAVVRAVAVVSVVAVAGADPGFFSGGGAPLRNDVTDSELKNF